MHNAEVAQALEAAKANQVEW